MFSAGNALLGIRSHAQQNAVRIVVSFEGPRHTWSTTCWTDTAHEIFLLTLGADCIIMFTDWSVMFFMHSRP